jgi:hypothetical protein
MLDDHRKRIPLRSASDVGVLQHKSDQPRKALVKFARSQPHVLAGALFALGGDALALSVLRSRVAVDLATGISIWLQVNSPVSGHTASWRTISKRTRSESAWRTVNTSIPARSGSSGEESGCENEVPPN